MTKIYERGIEKTWQEAGYIDTVVTYVEGNAGKSIAEISAAVGLNEEIVTWAVNTTLDLLKKRTDVVDSVSALQVAICDSGVNATTLKDVKDAIDLLEILSAEITEWGGVALTGRDISLDLKALTDDSIKGILKSLGDTGAGNNISSNRNCS